MAKKNHHVVRYDGGWAVRGENSERVSSIHRTQQAAINAGRKLAIRDKSELVIHGMDGKIRDKDSYNGDPCPPKDRKH